MTKQELIILLKQQFEEHNLRYPEQITDWWGSHISYSYAEDDEELIERIAEAIINKIQGEQ